MPGFFDGPEILFILACKGFYIVVILPVGTFDAAVPQYLAQGQLHTGAGCLRQCGFLPGGHNMRYRYAFFGQSGRVAKTGAVALVTRHGSCVEGLVLAVESCITGRSQYKRTNTVRQIIKMKGIT